MSLGNLPLQDRINEVWGKYMAYHIFNVPPTDYVKLYEKSAEKLGKIRLCHSVNDKTTQFSKSRDIKPDPKLYHYFASTTRQPLHTDYAYYKQSESPEWLMLYCMDTSEYGGKTHLLSTKTLNKILKKYNPDLLKKIKIDVKWEYKGNDGDKIHIKPLYDGKYINWNYWQIKEKHNSKQIINVRNEFFNFLEDVIVDGNIYDFSKTWNIGDCIIFNDRCMLHGRDAFLGKKRWLKDHAFFENKLN
tara:strand:- start:298 stop:1032 length:735 start_codon:yes stop_codon:yes gene_type:complete